MAPVDLEERQPAHHFRVIEQCPCPELIAPFVYIVLQGAPAESIYRGDDARAILNKYGHHSQYQLYHATPAERQAWGIEGQPDRPGESTHELKSDGRAYPWIPVGHDLEWWMQGFDVSDAYVEAVMHQAVLRGWDLFRPYGTGVEYHHLNFAREPRPEQGRLKVSEKRIIEVRNHLPRS